MQGDHIKIWTRYTVPEEFCHLLELYDADDGDGNVMEGTAFIAHVPGSLLDDELMKSCCGNANAQAYEPIEWLGHGVNLFGSNGVDVVKHPDGDGYLLVGGRV